MSNAALLASLDFEQVLPPVLGGWRPLVAEGLAHFLGLLPEQRIAVAIEAQLALPDHADAHERLVALLAQFPTLHKLGQVVARHRLLDPALRRELQSLESMPATQPMAEIAAHLGAELGGRIAPRLADAPLAEGSVAIVVPFTYERAGGRHHGVFKLLKPGIEIQLGEELAVLGEVAAFLEARGRALALPALDYRGTLKSVEELLACEVRLDAEQANLRAAASFYAGDRRIWIPRVLPWCTPRLTAMERVFGDKLTDARLDDAERHRVADTAISALLAQPFWSPEREAVFHADLHGGNLMLAADGRLAVLDWSLTTRLTKRDREAMVDVALAGLTLDAEAIRRAAAELGGLDATDATLGDSVERALDRLVLSPGLPGFAWVLGLMDALALRAPTRFSGDLALFRKTWLSLEGVLADLAGEYSPDRPLVEAGFARFLIELPRRFFTHPASREFSTHISNTGLARALASSCFASLRYWSRVQRLAVRAPSVH